jgi:hemerythrin
MRNFRTSTHTIFDQARFFNNLDFVRNINMNTYVPWKDIYSVGDASIDTQHMQIISILNDMFNARQSGNEDKVIKELLDRLVLYTQFHFDHEERKMQASDYSDFENHKAQHDQMRHRTEGFRINIDLITSRDLLTLLKDWWTQHIQAEDQCYVPYLSAAATEQQLADATA